MLKIGEFSKLAHRMESRIVTKPAFTVVGLPFTGFITSAPYEGGNENNEIGKVWDQFNARCGEIKNYCGPVVGLCFGMPNICRGVPSRSPRRAGARPCPYPRLLRRYLWSSFAFGAILALAGAGKCADCPEVTRCSTR